MDPTKAPVLSVSLLLLEEAAEELLAGGEVEEEARVASSGVRLLLSWQRCRYCSRQ